MESTFAHTTVELANPDAFPPIYLTIADDGARDYWPKINNDLVAYQSNVSGNDDIYLYRISDGTTFQLTDNPADQYIEDLFGNKVAYMDFRNGPADIYVSTFIINSEKITAIDLGTLDAGEESGASGINEDGEIVGLSGPGSSENRSFLIRPVDLNGDGKPDQWYRGTDGINNLMNELSIIFNPFIAYEINEHGTVAGLGKNLLDETHAFIHSGLEGTSSAIDLGTLPGGDSSAAFDINDSMKVVGRSNFGGSLSYQNHAFLWYDKNLNFQSDPGEMIDLGTLGGEYSEALGINNLDQIVGISTTSSPAIEYRAFLITPEDTDSDGIPDLWFRDSDADGKNDLMTNLGIVTSDRPDSGASAINDSSQVVGWTRSSDLTEMRAFLWTQENGMQEIDTFGGDMSYASDINNEGHVVGYSDLETSGERHAFIWTENGGMMDIGTLGGPYSSASNIDKTGKRVVGTAGTSTGTRHAVLWKISPNTSQGTNTVVGDDNVEITFDNVQTEGLTMVTERDDNPGFCPGEGIAAIGHFYEIVTTAIFSGGVTVCLRYEDPDQAVNENDLSLLHFKDGACEDVTTSRARERDTIIICGRVSSFSWFTLVALDTDGDGYNVLEDCDDANPDVNPGAGEVSDGIDNNCDGAIDEGFDQDGDGIADYFDNCPLDINDQCQSCNSLPSDLSDMILVADWIKALQYNDPDLMSYGAIKIHHDPGLYGTDGNAYFRVVPYFSNRAVSGLLRAPVPGRIEVAEKWIDWYLKHLNSTDTLPGVVYDHGYGPGYSSRLIRKCICDRGFI